MRFNDVIVNLVKYFVHPKCRNFLFLKECMSHFLSFFLRMRFNLHLYKTKLSYNFFFFFFFEMKKKKNHWSCTNYIIFIPDSMDIVVNNHCMYSCVKVFH